LGSPSLSILDQRKADDACSGSASPCSTGPATYGFFRAGGSAFGFGID
jgi:hypothetical protein